MFLAVGNKSAPPFLTQTDKLLTASKIACFSSAVPPSISGTTIHASSSLPFFLKRSQPVVSANPAIRGKINKFFLI